jgi:transcriptional regulator with XRE-family HTH domain
LLHDNVHGVYLIRRKYERNSAFRMASVPRIPPLMGIEGFASRLRRAFRALEDRLGRDLTQTELGEMVGKQLREDAISQPSVARWFAGTLPEHYRMVALAQVLGVDPGWLGYGSGEDEGDQPARNAAPRVPTPPLEMFRPITTGDDLRQALGEPIPKKRRRGGDEAG